MDLKSAVANRARILTDRRYRHFYRHRLVGDLVERQRLADALARTLPAAPAVPTVREYVDRLEQDGLVFLPQPVSSPELFEMRRYFETEKAKDPNRPEHGRFLAPLAAPSSTHVAYFDNDQVVRAPHALRIANDPVALATAGQVLGAKPTIAYMAAWWSLPSGEAAQYAELFHRDVDDLRFLKLFLYLTDVDETCGPHVFVRGSHKKNELTTVGRRIPDQEVEDVFGKEHMLRLTGRAGTCFLENTNGVHRGLPPAVNPRLIFQVLYSMVPYVGGPKKPIIGLPEGFDPYMNRVYCRPAAT